MGSVGTHFPSFSTLFLSLHLHVFFLSSRVLRLQLDGFGWADTITSLVTNEGTLASNYRVVIGDALALAIQFLLLVDAFTCHLDLSKPALGFDLLRIGRANTLASVVANEGALAINYRVVIGDALALAVQFLILVDAFTDHIDLAGLLVLHLDFLGFWRANTSVAGLVGNERGLARKHRFGNALALIIQHLVLVLAFAC